MQKLKEKFHEYIKGSSELPPLDDNDDYFKNASNDDKVGYIFSVLKKALAVFISEKELNQRQTEKLLELEARIAILEKRSEKNMMAR